MNSLREYILKWENGIDTVVPRELPTPYCATKEFGDTLLKIQGHEEQNIRDLFCIRTFALHYGMSRAIHLIKENYIDSTDTFPQRLYEMEEFTHINKTNAADLERAFLKWELASNIPDPTSCIAHSESKHIRSEAILEYSKVAEKVLKSITNTNEYDTTKSYFKKNILEMLRKCNIINLITKLDRSPQCHILCDIIKNDIYPNVLASVHATSPPF